jgi:hypothetical protein
MDRKKPGWERQEKQERLIFLTKIQLLQFAIEVTRPATINIGCDFPHIGTPSKNKGSVLVPQETFFYGNITPFIPG